MVKRHDLDDDESSEEEKFHVEVIKKARVNEDAAWEYLVKWAGYDSEADSWEPAANVQGCTRLLDGFWLAVGVDNKDYDPGYEVAPPDEWIAKERRFFKRTFGKEIHKEKDEKSQKGEKSESVGRHVPGKAVKTKGKTKKPGWTWVTDSESNSSEKRSPSPLTKAEKKLKKLTKKRPAKESSGSESDQPLRKVPRMSQSKKDPTASEKGKGKAKAHSGPHRTSHAAPRDDGVDSLFSAPSSPDVTLATRKLDSPAPSPSASRSAAKPAEKAVASTSAAPAATKPAAMNHRDRVPKVKPIDIPMIDASHAISTKARIASATIGNRPKLTLEDPAGLLSQQRAALKGLSFKKKHTTGTTDATPTSATATGQAADPRQRSLFTSEKDVVESPVSAPGGWGHSGWGQSPVHGGWGQSPTVTSGGWGAEPSPWASTSDDAHSGPSTWDEALAQSGQPATSAPRNHRPDATADRTTQPRRAIPPLPRRTALGHARQSPPQTTPNNDLHAADQFLAAVMPPQLAAPMHEPDGLEDIPVVAPPKVRVAKKPPVEDISKKWKWLGELYIEKGDNVAEKACNICLTDATKPRPEGLRLSILYRQDSSILRLQKFHEVSDISILLRACASIQQFCKITHQGDDDAEAVQLLAKYMALKRQFTYAHVYLDQDPIGILMVYPSAMTDICKYFQVPLETQQSSLIGMLLPWSVTVDEYQEKCWFPTRKELFLNGGRLDDEVKKMLEGSRKPCNALFSLGLRIHRFTSPVYEFFARQPRDYCIWHSPADGTLDAPGFETKALFAILNALKARNVGYKTDVRVIFVHVGALETFHTLVALGMRRGKRPDLRIYSYGTHETTTPDRWGLREIYPIGGIATFTPLAIIQSPFVVYDLIIRLEKHPLWLCYVHPYTVAAVAKITCSGRDPVQMLKDGEFFFEKLLRLIEAGKISLLRAPPPVRHGTQESGVDSRADWAGWLASLPSLNSKETLAECIKLLDKQFSRTPIKELSKVVEQQTMLDLCQLQQQPVIMDNYRRFVLLTESRNDVPDTCKDGVEISTTGAFSFKDEYFLKQ